MNEVYRDRSHHHKRQKASPANECETEPRRTWPLDKAVPATDTADTYLPALQTQ